MSPYNFQTSGCILTKLFPGDVMGGGGDNKMGITFGRLAPKNVGGRKKRPKFRALSDLTTFDFDREYLRNASTYCK